MKNTTSTRSRKFLILIVLMVIIGLLIRGYGNYLIKKTTDEITIEVTERVKTETRKQVIENAVLIESNDEGYVLSFEGEEHFYTFD